MGETPSPTLSRTHPDIPLQGPPSDLPQPSNPQPPPWPHTDRSTALMEVAKCSPDLTVQSSLRDPEITWEAVKLRVTVTAWLNELVIMQTCHYKEVAQEGIISRDPRFRDLGSKEDSFPDLVGG